MKAGTEGKMLKAQEESQNWRRNKKLTDDQSLGKEHVMCVCGFYFVLGWMMVVLVCLLVEEGSETKNYYVVGFTQNRSQRQTYVRERSNICALMLFLQIPLLAVLLGGGDSEDAFQDQILRTIGTFSLHNQSWTQTWISGWLGELQIASWKRNSGGFISLRPWSNGNFSNNKIVEIENLIKGIYNESMHVLHNRANEWMLEYPMEFQVIGGCELHSGEIKLDFWRVAYQGSEFLSFQNSSWVPSLQGGTRAQKIGKLLNQFILFNKMIHWRISNTCPRFLLGLLDAGKADLQRKVKPEAWLSTGPSPGPHHLLLVCHVSGFYPKPISVTWMRGEQAQQASQQSDILPNADETWYLRSYLDVEATKTFGLSCRVTHSSLEGQDIILYVDHPTSKGLIVLAVMVPLVLLLTGLAFWLKKRWKLCEPYPTLLPLERSQQPRDSKYT